MTRGSLVRDVLWSGVIAPRTPSCSIVGPPQSCCRRSLEIWSSGRCSVTDPGAKARMLMNLDFDILVPEKAKAS